MLDYLCLNEAQAVSLRILMDVAKRRLSGYRPNLSVNFGFVFDDCLNIPVHIFDLFKKGLAVFKVVCIGFKLGFCRVHHPVKNYSWLVWPGNTEVFQIFSDCRDPTKHVDGFVLAVTAELITLSFVLLSNRILRHLISRYLTDIII